MKKGYRNAKVITRECGGGSRLKLKMLS